MHTLDDTTVQFLTYLHRGGAYAFWWTAPDKQSHWWEIGQPAPIPNGHRNVYFGVNPVRTVPESNSRGIQVGEIDPATGRVVTIEALRSQIAYIAAINCLYAEFDYKDFTSPTAVRDHVDDLLPPPSVVINSGGGLHCYWLLVQPYLLDTPERRERAQHAQADFVQRVGGDQGAKDLARVLRVPGTHNYKEKYAPNYPEVSYVKRDLGLAYSLDDLIPRRKPKVAKAFTVTAGTDEAAKAQAALARLSSSRRETYQEWINVGMALYSLGEEGLRLWESWSSGSAKYRSGECEWRWRTFAKVTSITIGSLFHWADEDDPAGKRERTQSYQQREQRAAQSSQPRARTVHEPDYTPDITSPEPERVSRREHGLRDVKQEQREAAPCVSIEQARRNMRDEIMAYLADPDPGYMLLIAAPAGIGKTTIAIETAEYASMMRHMRVLFAGPRREFWKDILEDFRRNNETRKPSWWYEWQPRTLGQGQGVGQTCRHAPAIEAWQKKGYRALDFCKNPRICGWNYINDGCVYHAQRKRGEPIIFVQHEHVTMAHPLMEQAGLVIGDELPLRAFIHRWEIPTKEIVPEGLEHDTSDLASILRALRELTTLKPDKEDGPYWKGKALMTALGGAARVHRICEESTLDLGAVALAPDLRVPEDAENVPFFHLPSLVALLRREAAEAVEGRDYITRVLVGDDGLVLLLRRTPTMLPSHVIWLDATGNGALYSKIFDRPVKVIKPNVEMQGTVYQVWASRNNKHALEHEEAKRVHLKAQIDAIKTRYTDPKTITYKGLLEEIGGEEGGSHFGGNRGTNRLQDCDGLIVAGTPQPDIGQLLQTAAILFQERMTPFRTAWSAKVIPFEGDDEKGYTVSGFWDDTDLQLLLEQFREAELIQSINRARPLLRKVDIWLLSNVPLAGVPVRLRSLNDIFDAPKGVDPYLWAKVAPWAVECEADHGFVTTADLVRQFGISPQTAGVYVTALAVHYNWPEFRAAGRGRGQPPKATGRNTSKTP